MLTFLALQSPVGSGDRAQFEELVEVSREGWSPLEGEFGVLDVPRGGWPPLEQTKSTAIASHNSLCCSEAGSLVEVTSPSSRILQRELVVLGIVCHEVWS